MDNNKDFTIEITSIDEAVDAITSLKPAYDDAIKKIKDASEKLISDTNWKGKARDEFRDTYRIVEHYFEDDSDKLSSMGDIVKGFSDIYKQLDIDSAKKLADMVEKAIPVNEQSNADSSKKSQKKQQKNG